MRNEISCTEIKGGWERTEREGRRKGGRQREKEGILAKKPKWVSWKGHKDT